jgi:putative transposase
MLNQMRPTQQAFEFRTHGGARQGAGRKRTRPGKPRVSHRPRPEMQPRFAGHVTMRMRRDVPRLRNFELCAALRRAFVHGCKKDQFRICQFSIQRNHIHLMCEAVDNAALANGIQGWAVRVARAINRKLGRKGSVFDDRYHVEIIKTPRHCRSTLCYVLQNARRHGEHLDPTFNGMDPFSSAWWFDGWKDNEWRDGLGPPEARTVAEPETWLLREGWRRHCLLAIDEVPPAATS